MVTYTSTERSVLSDREFAGRNRWSPVSAALFSQQKGSRLLTSFGWFSVLAFAAAATGAGIAFVL
jgi:hypothetical protein